MKRFYSQPWKYLISVMLILFTNINHREGWGTAGCCVTNYVCPCKSQVINSFFKSPIFIVKNTMAEYLVYIT